MAIISHNKNTHQRASSKKLEEQFLHAVQARDAVTMIKCLDEGVDPNCHLEDFISAAHILARRGDMLLLMKLATYKGWNINVQTEFGRTPLHWACLTKKLKMVHLLLQYGADPNIKDHMGKTCLHYAAEGNSLKTVQLLVRFKARVNETDLFGRTPFSIVVLDRPCFAIAKFLGGQGVKMDKQHGSGGMHLLLAAVLFCHSASQVEVLRFLVGLGADPNVVEPLTRRNALHFAAITGFVPTAEALLDLNCNMYAIDFAGKTPLAIALDHRNYGFAECLLKADKLARGSG